MTQQIARILAVMAIAGLAWSAQAADEDQAAFPQVVAQPTDQDVPLGGDAVMSVESINGDSFQWLRNGNIMQGETNASLVLENVNTNDVGYYSCAVIKGDEVVPTREAALNVYTMDGGAGGPIVVFGAPVASGGSSGTCPGPYVGYVNYTKTVSQGWGWAPTAGVTNHTASDLNRTNTKVVYIGKYGDIGCAPTTVTIPHPTFSPKYRFSIYFTNNVPTNAYPITLTGFDP